MLHPLRFVRALGAPLVVLVAWTGCALPEEAEAEPEMELVAGLSVVATTTTFQNGIAPSAAYTGTTDTMLQEATPATAAGSDVIVRADSDYPNGTGKVANALLRFDLGAIPKGSTVTGATLTLDVSNPTSGRGFDVFAMRRSWNEAQATWSSAATGSTWSAGGARGAGDRGTTSLGTILPSAVGGYSVALNAAGVAAIQSWVDDGTKNFGLSIDAAGNVDGLGFGSSEAAVGATRPKLAVTWRPSTGGGTGLRGNYYRGKGFDPSHLLASRVDPTVGFAWGTASPAAGVPADGFSVRWSGQVAPLHSQTYTFTTRSDDGVRLWVGGRLLVDNWTDHGPTDNSGTIALVAGTRYDIVVEYYEASGGSVAQLSWASPSQPKQIVPASQLFPAAAPAAPTSACDDQKRARALLVVGAYRPGASTTGPLPCVPLVRRDGDLTVTEPNTVIEGIDLRGTLVLAPTATNVVVRHSILRGPAPNPNGGLVVSGGGRDWNRLGLVIEDSRIDLTGRESWFVDGIAGSHFTVRRTEILRTVDGVGLVSPGGNVTVEASWIHDGYWTSWTAATPQPKPSHSDMQTHNDGIQFHRGKNIVIRGNFVGGARGASPAESDDYSNAGLMIGQQVDDSLANKMENVLIEKNWFQGGAATIDMVSARGNDLGSFTIRDNRFLRGRGYYILRGAGVRATLANNVFDDTGLPVPIVNGG